ncbi:MAG TPA: molybdopterin cofactor-binding domain-containing protein [Puia sp.]|nr:molybdopterin cofactor-binding domain-containing protein [Puia sp.]
MQNPRPNISRRNFITQTGLTGIALTLGIVLPGCGNDKGGVVNVSQGNGAGAGTELMSWISVDQSGKVYIMNHRSEMGQGTSQAIPQIIAEELEVTLDQVSIRSAPANPKKYGPQPSDGSFSVRGWHKQLLLAGASARQMLITAAADRWKVPVSECYARSGEVIHHPSGKKLGYGALVEEAAKLPPPQNVVLKERKDYTVIGRPMPRLDTPLKTNGTAVFGLDKKLPGMLYAMVERSPRFRGKVKSIDDSASMAIAGVKRVLKVRRPVFGTWYEGVAVVADTLWGAMQARKALKVEWDDDGIERLDSDKLRARMLEDLKKPGPSEKFEAAYAKAAKKLEAVYETPYQSHSCMEPLNCIADVRDNSIEVWGPIQEANWIQAYLSENMKMPAANITVNMTFLGGGFGRKASPDYPYEAAYISREMKAPVQVVWTREDDMTMGLFRTGSAYACRGGLDAHGNISAFQAITASQPFGEGTDEDGKPGPASDNSGNMSGLLAGYLQSIPHYSFGWCAVKSIIPTIWWRAPNAHSDGFAGESFIDELAFAAGKDPLEFRKAHLPGARYQALIEKLETVSGWKGRGRKEGWGVAITQCFGSTVGHIVKVSKRPDGKIKIEKVFSVIDCGWYVNPDIISAQLEGSIVMGLGAAIKHETHFKDGMAVEKNFDTYPMPRIHDIPDIEVHIMENNEAAGGVGEPGLPPFAPALCNAIFDLTGKRIRKLPFNLEEV